MHNNAEGDTRGRSAANAMIKVNADNQVVEVKEIDGAQVTFVNGEATDVTYEEDQLTDKLRNEWIQEAVAAGMSRGDVAKILDVSYGVVYGLTKDAEGTRQTYTITLEDGTEIKELREKYSGKDRRKAFARFEEIQKQRPGIEAIKDIEKRSWEK